MCVTKLIIDHIQSMKMSPTIQFEKLQKAIKWAKDFNSPFINNDIQIVKEHINSAEPNYSQGKRKLKSPKNG